MFTHSCTACTKTQLIFFSQVTDVVASDLGTRASFTCWCGATQSAELSLDGRTPAPAAAVAA